jgi:hypothetical protein
VITPTVKHTGPPVTSIEDAIKFVQKHALSPQTVAGPYVEGDKLVVLTAKRSSDVTAFIKNNIHRAELSKDFSEALMRRFHVALNEEVFDACQGKVSEYRHFLKSFLRGAPHWLQALRS